MRFPFFKTQKPDSKEPINTASKNTPPADKPGLGATQRIPVGVLSSQRLNKTAAPATPAAPAKPASNVPAANGPAVILKVTTISSQIPTQVFSAEGRATVANATVSIPVHVILPQLATGKISIKLGELLTFFPAALLRSPLPPFPEQQLVALPLEAVIPAIPADLLHVTHESVISADDPELGKLPTLIDDETLAAHRRTRSTSLADTQPVRRLPDDLKPAAPKVEAKPQPAPAPKPVEAPRPVAPAPAPVVPAPAPVQAAPTQGRQIHLTLRGLVTVLPDQIFNCSRAELISKTNSGRPVPVPAEPLIPQLRTGVARMAVAAIVPLLPQDLLAQPMPDLEGLMVALPLAEVIPQLPTNLFTEDLREPTQVALDTDLDIPDPFQDKSALAAAAAAAAAAPIVETPADEADGVDVASLEDESFAIFTEKKSIVPPSAPVRAPEPVQPVAEVKAVAPVEIIPPQPVVAPEPVAVAPVEPIAEIKPVEIPVVAPVEPVAEIKLVGSIAEVKAVEPIAASVVAPEPVVADEPEPIVAAAPVFTPEPIIVSEAVPVAEIKPIELPVVAPVEPVAEVKPVEVVAAPAPVVAAQDPAYADADMGEEEEVETLAVAAKAEPDAEAPFVADERKFLVDLNRCTVEDLMTIPGIGRALAQRIIDFRNARGQFSSISELRQVPGIGRKTFRALAGIQPRALNRLLGVEHDGELTLQEIVRLTGKLPGIQGCMLALSDGLFLTGKLPPHLDQDTISVFAPQLFKKVGRYSRELKVGSIRRFTIFTDTQPLSIFKAGDVYLIIVHDAQRYSKALLRRCERISEEIARLSSQRVTV